MNQKSLPLPKDEPLWGGWALDPKYLPLKDMEKDGYGVEEVQDSRGKYWRIIKLILK